MIETRTNRQFILDAIIALAFADDDPIDLIELLETAQSILTPAAFIDLCLRFDACPIHICDLDTCADDDADECRRYRN
ncbi:MAG: hypothetical protein LC687_00010 [Actinobacteria bacterium]|nr:hypothetical protein [Actinomycetota bacterium]